MDNQTDLQKLRTELSMLREKRERVQLEKGLIARDNNDLRENFAYDIELQKEQHLTYKILRISREIEALATKRAKVKVKPKNIRS